MRPDKVTRNHPQPGGPRLGRSSMGLFTMIPYRWLLLGPFIVVLGYTTFEYWYYIQIGLITVIFVMFVVAVFVAYQYIKTWYMTQVTTREHLERDLRDRDLRAIMVMDGKPNISKWDTESMSFHKQDGRKVLSAPETQLALPEKSVENVPIGPVVSQLQSMIFFGGRGLGKTTNMLRVMEQRGRSEQVFVFDTHAHPSKWPHASEVIGSEIGITEEERFHGMWQKMMALIAYKNKRLDQYRQGLVPESSFSPEVAIYIDEFTHIPRKLKEYGYDIQDFTSEIITEGRKLNFNFIWGVHSDRVKALGLENAKDLLESFEAQIYLRMSKETRTRYAEITWSDGSKDERTFEPAPPYPVGQEAAISSRDIFDGEVEVVDILSEFKDKIPKTKKQVQDQEEEQQCQRFLELQAKYQEVGEDPSLRTITKTMFGGEYFGDNYVNKAIRVLEKYGIKHEMGDLRE